MIQAIRFYEEVRRGSSLPLLIGGDDGNRYVVKLNGAGDGVLSNVVEWVASKLGELMQIPVLQPVFVVIDASLAEQAGDPETRELLERSVGINSGTPYLPDAATYSARHAPSIDDILKQQIFLFDVFLLNIDRTDVNPNMVVHHGKLWCLDYSSALEIRSAINGEPYREYVILRHLKQHPFYRANLLPYDFINRLEKIPDSRIRDIVDEIPAEWISQLHVATHETESRSLITEKLLNKKRQGIALRARLDLLRVLKAETAEETQLRSLENRKAFEQKYGRL
ncbi:MAG: HipA family kinase [bacterium]